MRHTWPARLLHWVYVPALFLSALSGFYITKPSRSLGFRDTGAAVKTHHITQYVLIFAFLGRAYYSFVSRDYRELLPSLQDLKDIPRFLKHELFLSHKKPQYPKYNPAQKVAYALFALLGPLLGLTGLALYLPRAFGRVVEFLGGLNPVRKLHYLLAVVMSSLAVGHLYLVLTDNLRKTKSIFTGYE